MEISVERYHYPIGQGTFSAQIIRADEEKYVCVYDCGSISKTLVEDWVKDLQKVGWEGIVGRAPSEQQFLNALSRKDLVVCV